MTILNKVFFHILETKKKKTKLIHDEQQIFTKHELETEYSDLT